MALVPVEPAVTCLSLVAESLGAVALQTTPGGTSGSVSLRFFLAVASFVGAGCYKLGDSCAKRRRLNAQTTENTQRINELIAQVKSVQASLSQVQHQSNQNCGSVTQILSQSTQSEIRLQGQIDRMQGGATRVDRELQSTRLEAHDLQNQVDQVRGQVNQSDVQVELARQELREHADTATTRVQGLQRDLANVNDGLDGLRNNTQSLRTHVEQTSSAYAKVQRRLAVVDNEVGGLRASTERLQEEAGATRTDLQQLQAGVDHAAGNVHGLYTDVNNLAARMGRETRKSFERLVDNVNHALSDRSFGSGPLVERVVSPLPHEVRPSIAPAAPAAAIVG